MIVGVGGQGVIMVSKVLAALCQRHGLQVKQSEVHGMAKRGGSVFSHVRFGPEEVWSPDHPEGRGRHPGRAGMVRGRALDQRAEA